MDEELIRRLYQELRPMARNFARRAPEHYDEDDLLQLALIEIDGAIRRTGITALSYLVGVARTEMKRVLSQVVMVQSLDRYLYNEQTGRRRDIAENVEMVRLVTLTEDQERYVRLMLKMSTQRQQAILKASFGLPTRRGYHWTPKVICKRYGLSRWHFDQLQAALVRKWRVDSPIS